MNDELQDAEAALLAAKQEVTRLSGERHKLLMKHRAREARAAKAKRDRTDKVQAFALHRERAMLAYAKPADREAIARAICEGFGDDPEREGPFADWFEGAFGDAVDRILSLPHPKQGEMT